MSQDTLQWIYSMLQEQRKLHDRMEENLEQNKPVLVYEDLKNCKNFVDTEMSQLFQLAEKLGIEIKTFPYKPIPLTKERKGGYDE